MVLVDGMDYELGYWEVFYVGCGNKEVVFKSSDVVKFVYFYLNFILVYYVYFIKKIIEVDVEVVELGVLEIVNYWVICKLIVNSVVEVC